MKNPRHVHRKNLDLMVATDAAVVLIPILVYLIAHPVSTLHRYLLPNIPALMTVEFSSPNQYRSVISVRTIKLYRLKVARILISKLPIILGQLKAPRYQKFPKVKSKIILQSIKYQKPKNQ